MNEMETKKCDVCEEFKDVKELNEIHGILVCDRCFCKCADCEIEYIAKENQAYESLVKSGFRPNGITKDFKKVVVFKIENEHKNNERKEVFHFANWQEAKNKLCKNISAE